jgi:hypothetical protein
MAPTPANRVTFPTVAWVAMAAVFGAMLVLLTIQLTSIESQRRLVRDQDRKISALTRETLPLLRATRPLVSAAGDAIPSVRRALRAADPVGTLGAVRDLTTSLTRQDRLIRLIDASLGALSQISDRGLLERADVALRDVPVALDALRRTVTLQRDLLRVQRGTFELQVQSLDVQRQSLAVQRESLVHVRSLDRKTGGTVGSG